MQQYVECEIEYFNLIRTDQGVSLKPFRGNIVISEPVKHLEEDIEYLIKKGYLREERSNVFSITRAGEDYVKSVG